MRMYSPSPKWKKGRSFSAILANLIKVSCGAKLADQFGLAQSQIHGYETDAYEPEIATLKLFAAFFETSVDYLVGNTEIRHKIEPVEKYELNSEEYALMEKYRELSPDARKSVLIMIDTILGETK